MRPADAPEAPASPQAPLSPSALSAQDTPSRAGAAPPPEGAAPVCAGKRDCPDGSEAEGACEPGRWGELQRYEQGTHVQARPAAPRPSGGAPVAPTPPQAPRRCMAHPPEGPAAAPPRATPPPRPGPSLGGRLWISPRGGPGRGASARAEEQRALQVGSYPVLSVSRTADWGWKLANQFV
jgi:hypothetical protein